MSAERERILLVGDNPFHGISHLSQERARVRGDDVTSPTYAANLVMTALENGADGFMFSVSETTLSILRIVSQRRKLGSVSLYALAPYAYEYVRLATQAGGIFGLGKKFAKQVALSGNVRAIAMGLKGVMRTDPIALMKTYLTYEVSRIKSSAGKLGNLDSLLLHEVITDMALALDLDWLFRSYVGFMLELGAKPGFETRNFPYLVNKFREWDIDFGDIVVATPFNRAGFQMNPCKTACEQALASVPELGIIAMSILASGYLKPSAAMKYIASLPNLAGIVVGVSKEEHARETFRLLKERFKGYNTGEAGDDC